MPFVISSFFTLSCLAILALAGISGCAHRSDPYSIRASSERNPAFEQVVYTDLLVLAKTQDMAARTVLEDQACARIQALGPAGAMRASHGVISQAPSLKLGLEHAAHQHMDGVLVFRIEGHDDPGQKTLFNLDRLEGAELIDVKTGKRAWICTASWPGEDPRTREEEAIALRALVDQVMLKFSEDMLPKKAAPR